MSHDLIVSGGSVIDGTGSEPRRADVAIDGDRITRVGDLSGAEAAQVIDATGKVVTPGFVTPPGPKLTPREARHRTVTPSMGFFFGSVTRPSMLCAMRVSA